MSTLKKKSHLNLIENQIILQQQTPQNFITIKQNEQISGQLNPPKISPPQHHAIKTLRRQNALTQIEEDVQFQQMQIETSTKRKTQFLFSFIISLIIPMINATLMASMMILSKDDRYTAQKSWICIAISIFMFAYFTIEAICRFGIIKYLQYYFYLDRLVPGNIASSIAYLAMTKEDANLYLYNKVAQITFAFWLFTMSGNLRVSIKEYKWSRWHIFFTKLAYLYCGTATLYSGVCYIYSAVYLKFPVMLRDHIKDLVLLFILGTVMALYEHYKFISRFDQTDKLIPPVDLHEFEQKKCKKRQSIDEIQRILGRAQERILIKNHHVSL